MKRSTPLKRTGWTRSFVAMPEYKRDQREKNKRMSDLLDQAMRATPRKATMSGGTTGPIPKGPKADPGKGAPSKEERRWLGLIVQYGCMGCIADGEHSRPPAVHHILRGGVRMGHMWTLPLCDPGHHQNPPPSLAARGMVPRHPNKARFEAKYGTDLELLAALRLMLGYEGPTP